ncbi:hypothetical protein CDAR_390391 [Caerostris darwini]|uniref:Uncharacterized protein n=1 Tax=Caerostris darwini TaxID=1538125 RepID=A0AAV4NXY4_9ARAC|nr:hypothetical protein CDAR_390391 [Caerostris darwini]
MNEVNEERRQKLQRPNNAEKGGSRVAKLNRILPSYSSLCTAFVVIVQCLLGTHWRCGLCEGPHDKIKIFYLNECRDKPVSYRPEESHRLPGRPMDRCCEHFCESAPSRFALPADNKELVKDDPILVGKKSHNLIARHLNPTEIVKDNHLLAAVVADQQHSNILWGFKHFCDILFVFLDWVLLFQRFQMNCFQVNQRLLYMSILHRIQLLSMASNCLILIRHQNK